MVNMLIALILAYKLIQKILHSRVEIAFLSGIIGEGRAILDVLRFYFLSENVLLIEKQNHGRLKKVDVVTYTIEQLQGLLLHSTVVKTRM